MRHPAARSTPGPPPAQLRGGKPFRDHNRRRKDLYAAPQTTRSPHPEGECPNGQVWTYLQERVLKCVGVKYPSEACLKSLREERSAPRIADCEVVTSKVKKSFCAWLLTVMKRQVGEDPLFERIGGNVYARMCGPDWDEISASLQINP